MVKPIISLCLDVFKKLSAIVLWAVGSSMVFFAATLILLRRIVVECIKFIGDYLVFAIGLVGVLALIFYFTGGTLSDLLRILGQLFN